jgi:DNA-binding MarR family transcriptional regulator
VPSTTATASNLDAVTDAVLLSSRVLVAVASRSLAAVDESVTLPQFRALVVLDRADRKVGELARELRIQPSTATRLCDRLVRQRLVKRTVDRSNRREIVISLSPKGRELVHAVTRRRRREIAQIMRRVPPSRRDMIVEALTVFQEAAGEDPLVATVPW